MELEGPRSAIAAQLIDLEAALRQLDLWSDTPPSQEAMSSEQPFAMDSLEFEEWLQFIFLPTLYEVLASGGALPERCAIAPMAEETVGKKALPTEALISTLSELDRLITESDGRPPETKIPGLCRGFFMAFTAGAGSELHPLGKAAVDHNVSAGRKR